MDHLEQFITSTLDDGTRLKLKLNNPLGVVENLTNQVSQDVDGQVEALKAGVLGSGTLYGVDQRQRTDDRYRDAYARCMRSRGYSR